MTDRLYKDLSSDRNMGWVQRDSWLTYLSLDAPSQDVTYDLGVSNNGVIRLAPFGTPPVAVVAGADNLPKWLPSLPLYTPEWVVRFLIAGLVLFIAIFLFRRARKRRSRYIVENR
jgi:hypothetical protein